ncbi:hypothetical protein [Lacibacter sediminis]|uniref:Uncharacterized protein n=1 Tax=Lacibacter sediminis TaxID=2760713 RepID=A0A7G5XJE2_9BACT|nr:hypothetical protein [Lacibacter sediminis]QNA45595.1 hypothetical protein H4075_05180 [Lacibacter sediminis]
MAETRFFFASKQCRDSVSWQLQQQVERTVQLPLNNDTYDNWMGAFWAMELMLYKPAVYTSSIPKQIEQLPTLGPGFQRSFFEMLYTLYPGEFNEDVKRIWQKLRSDKVKAMALEYLALSNVLIDVKADDAFTKSAYFSPYTYVRSKSSLTLPAKNLFLDTSFLKGQTVLCSFQSTDRNKPGYLMIHTADGKWLTDDKGNELRFPQLARAINNLPFYLTNGNTPQGLYRINGFDTSDNNWIGPTTNLQMCLPFEKAKIPFFEKDTAYQTVYENLLGVSLNQYKSLWESFTAGKLGRTEIIAHGTTIDPVYYRQQTYFPNTPSMGCLCSPEQWNENGERIYSSQAEWINLVMQLKQLPQYLIVAEVNDL